eukprot:CAMPEP_0180532620 /NCGR_PEP_ID=MMETSP1036_2-20121128/63160_1 /TAXON_ID=632150 /ORGANISM="Azadinium spinosum, Strain 3D9" /LENGTH=54 /DNA_ID=CAMNT_0022546721 /DNA_START=16 /DNA_END=176 /DNA_ORIENTATION=+
MAALTPTTPASQKILKAERWCQAQLRRRSMRDRRAASLPQAWAPRPPRIGEERR